ncbi:MULTISPECIES: CC/Se motif family (seleno)protein [Bacillaceae]|uniref:Fe-S oxidoreductase n=1 Tax=Peribacillus huizhouensis TaxID=1501239 RepID=A0ABR6CQ30_9BACI|nr:MULTISPECIES: CC/Se motif family (seleno)protein [Bacillaceae]MBA9027026.1 hypothetical protein [Peribacillus huizhouensis]
MIIEIEEQAKKWIEAKGNTITVKNLVVNGCCSVGIQEIVAVPGKPKYLEQYREMRMDHLSVYVQNNITVQNKLLLKLSGISFLKSISVTALQ